jgi:PKD repeat protein
MQIIRQHNVSILPITDVTIYISGADSQYVSAAIDNFTVQNLTVEVTYTLQVAQLAPLGELAIQAEVSYHADQAFTQTVDEDFLIDTTVEPDIVAAFSADTLFGEAPFTVQFSNESYGDIIGYTWDFGDSSGSELENPLHTYQYPGLYTVTLYAYNFTWYNQEVKENYINVGGSTSLGYGDGLKGLHATLLANYPNPFNPSTLIKFTLPKRQFVVLEIYNSAGHKIKTLNAATLQAGAHELRFKASGMASGIYYYMLRTETFIQTRKMVLIK